MSITSRRMRTVSALVNVPSEIASRFAGNNHRTETRYAGYFDVAAGGGRRHGGWRGEAWTGARRG